MEERKIKILIADDEEGLRLSMAGILEMEGYQVTEVDNGSKAIEEVKKGSYDIAFLDIKMPGLNGVESFKEIKKISPETVVIMMTAFAVNDLIKEAINEGAYACLSKPFDMEKIMATIKEVSTKPFVLVIDDDPALCNLLSEKFKESGYTVVTKNSGIDGIEAIKRKIPDIVFLDVVMQDMDGLETFKKMKEMLNENCPKTVIMSSYDVKNKFDLAKDLGALDCMRKPLDISKLENLIHKSLDSRKKLKICVVDDDKNLCDSLEDILVACGYEVETAYSGSEFLDKIKKEAFKIVILDLRLPDINGMEVYEKIKMTDPNLGVIFVSGYSPDDSISETIKKNNYFYLHKPFEPEDLLKTVSAIARSKYGKTV